MPKRTVCIQKPSRLRTKNNQLIIATDECECAVPLEDIWVLILETHQATLSVALLSDLAKNGIGVITCANNHMPIGLHLPLGAHSRHAAIVEHQLAISKPLKKQLWKKIVIQKILNQSKCLQLLNLPGSEYLNDCASEVLSGDSSGREAVAASYYFRQLIPEGTRRDSTYTASLDYGYSVLRAGIARCAVAGGWLVSRGINHCSELNAFNLVDDLIEPFRPVVDQLVFSHNMKSLSTQTKQELSQIASVEVIVGEGRFSVQTAIEVEVNSLKESILSNNAQLLKLPALTEISFRKAEDR